jgi:Zn-dependent peptidase ImmA (M78 family)
MERNPEFDANRILETIWAKDDPSQLRLPVDPFYIAKALGISVYGKPLDPDISGMLIKRSHADDPEMILNLDDHRNRQRFTCAHELGHFNLRSQRGSFEDWEYVDHRGTLAGEGTDPDEMYANAFAATLLMPQRAIKKLWDGDGEVAPLAYTFGVSVEAMSNRLKNLGLL